MLSREKMAKAATEVAEHLQIIENIRALQTAQKEISNEIKAINQRHAELQVELRAFKAEVKFEALKETQIIVNAVQGSLNQRLETLSNKVAVMEATFFPGDRYRAQTSFGLGQEPLERTPQLESSKTAQDS